MKKKLIPIFVKHVSAQIFVLPMLKKITNIIKLLRILKENLRKKQFSTPSKYKFFSSHPILYSGHHVDEDLICIRHLIFSLQ